MPLLPAPGSHRCVCPPPSPHACRGQSCGLPHRPWLAVVAWSPRCALDGEAHLGGCAAFCRCDHWVPDLWELRGAAVHTHTPALVCTLLFTSGESGLTPGRACGVGGRRVWAFLCWTWGRSGAQPACAHSFSPRGCRGGTVPLSPPFPCRSIGWNADSRRWTRGESGRLTPETLPLPGCTSRKGPGAALRPCPGQLALCPALPWLLAAPQASQFRFCLRGNDGHF